MRAAIPFVCSALLALVGCTSFPTIEERSCGNFILEAGEDCDSSAVFDEGTCGAPETANACFQVCDSAGLGCPIGWGCGADLRCRAPSGQFELAADGVHSFEVDRFALGDVDGDGNLDLIGNQGDEVHVLFGDQEGGFAGEIEVSTQNPLGPMVFGNFDSDERVDVVVPTADGVLVLLGSSARTLDAKTFVSSELGSSAQHLAALEVAENDQTEVIIVDESLGQVRFQGSGAAPLNLSTGANSTIAGAIAVAELHGGGGQEFALAVAGASSMSVFSSTGSFPRGGANNLQVTLLQSLSLPADALIGRGVQLLDIDSDGDSDMLLSLATPAGERLFVATNTQAVDPASLFAAPVPFTVGGQSEQRWPLAIADLNADNVPDFVLPDGIYIANFEPGGQPGPIRSLTQRAQAGSRLWNTAVIGDFNGDGLADVGAGTDDEAEVTIQLGLGNGLFNAFIVQSARAPKAGPGAAVVGDFDGDFVEDLAFAGVSAEGGDTLEVIFGASSGGFASPVSMGELENIAQLLPVLTVDAFGHADGIVDVLVVSDTAVGKATAQLRGSSSRRMVSHYVLSHFDPDTAATQVQIPSAIVTGDFSAPADGITDIIAIAKPPVEDISNDGTENPALGLGGPSVWLIPGLDGDGNLDTAATPTFFGNESLFNEDCANWIAGNIDQGLDELIGLDGSAGCYSSEGDLEVAGEEAQLSLLVARAPDPGNSLFGLDVHEISGTVPLSNPRELRLVDFDNDGAEDLLAIFAGDPFAADPASTSGTVLFWNVDGDLVQGRVDTAIGDYSDSLRSIRAIHLNDDEFPDWVVVAEEGVYVAEYDPSTKFFSEPTLNIAVSGSRQAEVGDVNQDGVDDLVVLFGTEVKVLLGVPANSLGGATRPEDE